MATDYRPNWFNSLWKPLAAAVGMLTFANAPTIAIAGQSSVIAAEQTDPDKVIKCRKIEVTGSLVKKGKVCRTVAEWRQIMANGNRTARAVVESGQVCAAQCSGQ